MSPPLLKENDVRAALAELGFEPEEATVLLHLLSGEATVAGISKATSLGRTKVYSVMDRLLSLGVVVEVAQKPRTFALSDLEAWVKERRARLDIAYDVLEKELIPIYRASQATLSHILTLTGRHVSQRILEMISRARESVEIRLGFLPPEVKETIVERLESLKRKDIHVRALVLDHVDGLTEQLSSTFGISEDSAGLVVVDRKEVLIGTGGSRDENELVGIWSNNHALVAFQQGIFDAWASIVEKTRKAGVAFRGRRRGEE